MTYSVGGLAMWPFGTMLLLPFGFPFLSFASFRYFYFYFPFNFTPPLIPAATITKMPSANADSL